MEQRPIEDIENEIIAYKDAQTELSGLTTTSKSSIWRMLVYVVARAIYSLESNFIALKEEINTMLNNRISHGSAWYAEKILAFQYGDVAQIINYVPGYPVIDEAKQIIKRVSVTESGGNVSFKVAKETGGELVKLTATELTAAVTYLAKIKDAGVKTSLVSLDADTTKPYLDIYYSGEELLATMQTNVNAAIEAYFEDFNNNNFDGVIYLSKLIDAIQAVENVHDVLLREITFNAGATDITAERIYRPAAGYVKIDPLHDMNDGVTVRYIVG